MTGLTVSLQSTSKIPKQPIERMPIHLMGRFLVYSNPRDFASARRVSKQ